MKLTQILSQYFFTNHALTLAGIGTFSSGNNASPENISFIQNAGAVNEESLVSYISQQTGKMRSLAESDLESFLELATQFLHIGKPFQLEGIGTLVKNKAGELIFTPSGQMIDSNRDTATKELAATSLNEEAFGPYDSNRNQPTGDGLKKGIFFLLLIGGIVLAVWGGYWLFKKSQEGNTTTPAASEEVVPVTDTTTTVTTIATDSTAGQKNMVDSIAIPTTGYKFILEKGTKNGMVRRYNQLKSYFWDVHLQTGDSVTYKIYMQLPVAATDTTKVKDSLTVLTGKKVWIEGN